MWLSGLRVNEGVVAANLAVHLPFMVMEGVMMGAAGAGRRPAGGA